MSLQPYQLCRWCDGLMHGWKRWLLPGANVFLLLLMVLMRPLRTALAALLLLVDASAGLYLLYLHRSFGAEYQRVPRPQDAQGETVLIDAALIGEGTRLRQAAQPFAAADSLSLRLGSGALLLGTAMTLTADELPPAERAAVLSAVQQLNIKPDRMRSHSPVQGREQAERVSRVTVRDGVQTRAYFVGSPEDVLALAAQIWDGQARQMSEEDRQRCMETACLMGQENRHALAWATALADEPPVFLGMAGLGASVHAQAAQDVAALRAQGLTVMLAAENGSEGDAEALRLLLELPAYHAREDIRLTTQPYPRESPLAVTCAAGDSLLAPVMHLRQRFYALERALRRFALLLGWPLLISVLFGCWPAAAVSAGMLTLSAAFAGVDLDGAQPRGAVWLGLGAAAAAARLFLASQTAAVAQMSGGCLAVLAAMGCAYRLSGAALCLRGCVKAKDLMPVCAGMVYVLATALLCRAAAGEILLSFAFTLAVASVMNILLLCEHRIFR